jgi:hypothetical protein
MQGVSPIRSATTSPAFHDTGGLMTYGSDRDRRLRAVLKAQINKTDRNDARGEHR